MDLHLLKVFSCKPWSAIQKCRVFFKLTELPHHSSLIALRPISSMKYEETTRQTVMETPEKVSESVFWYLLLNAVQFCGVPGEMEGLCLGNRHRWRGHPIGRLACSRFGSKETARLIPSRHIQTKPSQTCRQNCQCSVEVLFKFINLYRNRQKSLWWQQARKVKVMFGGSVYSRSKDCGNCSRHCTGIWMPFKPDTILKVEVNLGAEMQVLWGYSMEFCLRLYSDLRCIQIQIYDIFLHNLCSWSV